MNESEWEPIFAAACAGKSYHEARETLLPVVAMRASDDVSLRNGIEKARTFLQMTYPDDAFRSRIAVVREELTEPDGEAGPADSGAGAVPDNWARPGEVLLSSPAPKARFKTGIPALDRALRGGVPTGTKPVVIQGEPDSGKSAIALQIADEAEKQGAVVAIYAPDCGAAVVATRLGALRGLDAAKLEDRDPTEVGRLVEVLAESDFFIADESEQDLEGFVAAAGRYRPEKPHLLAVDSIQEAVPRFGKDLDERARVIANVRILMGAALSAKVPTAVIATSETTKASYAARNPADRTRPIAGGAETAKIGFAAALILQLDGDPASPDGSRAAVVKTKLGGGKPEFRLRLDPATTRLSEVDGPAAEEERLDEDQRERAGKLQSVIEDVVRLLTRHPSGLSGRAIKERVHVRAALVDEALDLLDGKDRAVWTREGNAHIWRLV